MKTLVRKNNFHYLIVQMLLVFYSTTGLFGIAHAGCKGGVGTEDIFIRNKDSDYYKSDDVVDCITNGSITLGPDITITNGAIFNLVAPRVFFQTDVEVLLGSQLRIYSSIRSLNDTGIIVCSNDDTYDAGCPVATHPGQDAEYGRDADNTANDDSDGHAGFSFSRVCNSGELAGEGDCPAVPSLGAGDNEWACTEDNVTGLIWEVKTDDDGLHDKDDGYNWYSTDSSTNGGHPGYEDDHGDICYGYDINDPASYCNTQAYIARVNQTVWCGHKDWRMPTREELRSLVDYSVSSPEPTIDMRYFPNDVGLYMWSSSTYADDSSSAWLLPFSLEGDYWEYKENNYNVRLVRGVD